MKRIAVVAKVKGFTGKEDQLKTELLKLVEPSRADAGCLLYELHQDPEEPIVFMFYERWESRKALDEHLGQPHVAAFVKNAGELLDGPLDVKILEILS